MKLFDLRNVVSKLPEIHFVFEPAFLETLGSLKEDQNVRIRELCRKTEPVMD